MTPEQRASAFIAELEMLRKRYGIDLKAPYEHNINGLKISGDAPLTIIPVDNWQPPMLVPEPNGAGNKTE